MNWKGPLSEHKPDQNNISIMALGDVCPGDHYFSLGHGTGSRLRQKGVAEALFSAISVEMARADIVLINLEGPLSNTSNKAKDQVESTVFRGSPGFAKAMANAGISLAHIANNHILQHGEKAFSDTLDALRDVGIMPLGLLSEEPSYYTAPVFKNVAGINLAILGYSAITERYLPGQKYYAYANPDKIRQDIATAKNFADEIIVSLHFGEEGVNMPSPSAVDLAQLIAEAGAKLLIGHHPHVFQPLDFVNGCLVAYSLGDAIFDLFWDQQLIDTALVEFCLQGSESSWNYRYLPVKFSRKYQIEIMESDEADEFQANLEVASQQLLLDRQTYECKFQTLIETADRSSAIRKFYYLISNLFRGNRTAKFSFLARKFSSRLID